MAVPATWASNLITYGNGVFLALGANGADTCIDGATWVPRATPSAVPMGCLCYNSGIFVAANGNYIDTVGGAGSNVINLYAENNTDSDYMYISGTAGKFVRVK